MTERRTGSRHTPAKNPNADIMANVWKATKARHESFPRHEVRGAKTNGKEEEEEEEEEDYEKEKQARRHYTN